MLKIRHETPGDYKGIRQVNRQAFSRDNEAELVERLRNNDVAAVSLVAELEGQLAGHIMFNPVTFEPDIPSFKALTLAPLAVVPAYQRRGIGSKLVEAGIRECRKKGYDMIFLVGHADYYPRFGFVPASSNGFKCEYEAPNEAWLMLSLRDAEHCPESVIVYFNRQFKYVV